MKKMKYEQVLEPACVPDRAQLTLREARAIFYRGNGFPEDGGAAARRWSPFACRDLKAHLPNFKWRRRALPIHDLHHVITGYEFSPLGEFEMSAWEFAAGRYPHVLSTLFCLPLVSMGAVVIPRRTFAAFVRGRKSSTLYSVQDIDAQLEMTVSDVRRERVPAENVRANGRDVAAFVLLVTASALLIASPVLLASAIWLLWR
jgi:hypothetical protein